MKKILIPTVMFLLSWNVASAQRAIPLTLKTMVQQAGTIVHAVVSETRTGRDPVTGMPATWVTLEVTEDFHGAPGKTFTFKQVGGEIGGMAYRPADVPGFSASEEVILLLYPEHPTTGFRSPVGLGQGKFVVRTFAAPKKQVAEQITRSPQLMKTGQHSDRSGSISVDILASELRTLVRSEKGGVK